MKVFVYTELPEVLQFAVKGKLTGHEVTFRKTETESPPAFAQAELLLGNPPGKWMDEATHLRFWQLDSAGFDQYSSLNVSFPVANMGDYFSVKCAETIVGGILAFYRNIHELVRLQASSKWIGKPLRYQMDLLTGKKVIIAGAGTIGQAIAKMLTGFDCDIRMMARTNPQAAIHTKEELLHSLTNTGLLINTLPGTARHFIDEECFNAIRDGALYATVGRGSTTDERALIKALQSGKLGGAVLDVTEREPLPEGSPLWKMQNVILTQHTAGGYRYEDEGKIDLFIRNVERFLKGEKLLNQVTLSGGY